MRNLFNDNLWLQLCSVFMYCVCVCVCVCVCMFVCMCACICMHMFTHAYMFVSTSAYNACTLYESQDMQHMNVYNYCGYCK